MVIHDAAAPDASDRLLLPRQLTPAHEAQGFLIDPGGWLRPQRPAVDAGVLDATQRAR